MKIPKDDELRKMAILGLKIQRDVLDKKIAELEGLTPEEPKQRFLSAAARARISMAQKKRWKIYHQAMA